MRSALLAGCLGLFVATACTESTRPVVSPLVGSWATPQENLHPMGRMTRFLSFSGDGTFMFATYSYGIYGGSDLAAYTRTSGTYEVEGDRVICTATRVATWDSFYGASSPETVQQVNYSLFDQARFRVILETLTLEYITYPADAPVPTTLSFMSLRVD